MLRANGELSEKDIGGNLPKPQPRVQEQERQPSETESEILLATSYVTKKIIQNEKPRESLSLSGFARFVRL